MEFLNDVECRGLFVSRVYYLFYWQYYVLGSLGPAASPHVVSDMFTPLLPVLKSMLDRRVYEGQPLHDTGNVGLLICRNCLVFPLSFFR